MIAIHPLRFLGGAALLAAAALAACGNPDSPAQSSSVSQAQTRAATPKQTSKRPTVGQSGTALATTTSGRPISKVVATPPSGVITRQVSYEEAETAYRDKEYGNATRLFDAYTEQRPDNPWGHYMLGLSAWKAGDLSRAEDGFDGALIRDPNHVKSLVNLSRVLIESDQPEKALGTIEKAVELDPASGQIHRVLGNVQSELGQVEHAIGSYRTAIRLEPGDAWALNNLGLMLIQQGREEEALPPLALANELKPEVPVFLNNLGVALERSGFPSAAGDAFAAALDADSSYAKAEVSLARVESVTKSDTDYVDLPALARAFALEIEGSVVTGEPIDETDEIEPEAQVGG
ncbi:MAG: tetratricopeptide repeat protein [Gemmatimonadota bacterium]